MDTNTRTTTAKIRFPKEFLAVVDEYAAAHQQPRSVAVRALILRGMAWNEAWQQQRTEALEELERESPKAETGKQWADICAREAELAA
jgi:hypothetical protein